jgi:group I intron endonuclease
MIGIYKYENKLNGKIYIGQSTNINQRYKSHLNPSRQNLKNSLIDKAIQKYGIESFNFEILETFKNKNNDKLNQREIYWIEKYNSFKKGYNLTKGGKNFNITPKKGSNHYKYDPTEYKFYNTITKEIIETTLNKFCKKKIIKK